MTPEQREDLQWLIHLGMDGKVVAPVHAASIRAALAEIDSLTAEVERRKNAGAWDCAKHREAEQAKTKAALDHAKELETALVAICVEAGGTRDHSPGFCLQQIVGTIETLKRAVKEHADHMDVCLEATYKGERDHVRRLLDMKDHDYALINYDLRKAEARVKELEAELDETHEGWATEALSFASVVASAKALRIDANRLCDRNLGGTYEDDCRRAIAAIDAALGAAEEKP